MEEKIEEFLEHFGQRVSSLSEEAFRTQVTALVKLKEHEDAHLGEEVERHWMEVMTQQYVFRRLEKEVRLPEEASCRTSAPAELLEQELLEQVWGSQLLCGPCRWRP